MSDMGAAHSQEPVDGGAAWPLFGLRLHHGDLALRVVTDADALALAAVVEFGLLPAEHQHFLPMLGHLEDTAEQRRRGFLRFHWGVRAALTADDWELPFTVVRDGQVIGTQSLAATSFPLLRTVHTGSYLAGAEQGRGLGTRMRAMVLELAFAHLGAARATSSFAAGNTRSAGVSARLGYQDNGVDHVVTGDVCHPQQRLLLGRDDWAAHRPEWLDEMTVKGVDACLSMLGATGSGAAT
jgi:RimJ/RimL family protein N-acetyltransferase